MFQLTISFTLQKMTKLEERVVRKDKIILQLEQKIRSQESTIQDLVLGSGTRTTRSTRGSAPRDDNDKLKVIITIKHGVHLTSVNQSDNETILRRVLNISTSEHSYLPGLADISHLRVAYMVVIFRRQWKRTLEPNKRNIVKHRRLWNEC